MTPVKTLPVSRLVDSSVSTNKAKLLPEVTRRSGLALVPVFVLVIVNKSPVLLPVIVKPPKVGEDAVPML